MNIGDSAFCRGNFSVLPSDSTLFLASACPGGVRKIGEPHLGLLSGIPGETEEVFRNVCPAFLDRVRGARLH